MKKQDNKESRTIASKEKLKELIDSYDEISDILYYFALGYLKTHTKYLK